MNFQPSSHHIPFGGRAIGVIPARCASTRFPDKPLALINGVPLVCWTLSRARRAGALQDVFVAAEDPQIVEAVCQWGGKATLVQGNFRSGSDRVAEAVRSIDAPAIVNIQSDEPLISPADIDEALRLLENHPEFGVATLVRPILRVEEYLDPNCVKAVMDENGRCLYFSRSPIPALHRQGLNSGLADDAPCRAHIGLYCYRRTALQRFAGLPRSPLEECEGLEQLRFLEFEGIIGALEVKNDSPNINTPDDLNRVEQYITEHGIEFSLIP